MTAPDRPIAAPREEADFQLVNASAIRRPGVADDVARLVADRTTIILQLNVSPFLGTPDELRPMAEDVAAIVFRHD